MTPPDRQPVLEDREALYEVAADPLIWALHFAHDRWQRPVFDACLASGGAVIGSSRYDGWDARADEIEIGWTWLARSHWSGA